HLDLISNPPNDNFTNSAPITGLDATVTGSNIGATREAQEPAHAGQVAGNSVWWSWTAPVTGGVIISTDGSDFDTTVTAYRGTSLSDLQWINADDDSGEGTRSKIAFNAQEGVTYHLAVTGFGDGTNPSSEGNIVLHLRVDAPGAIPFTDLAETPDLKLWKEGNATAFAFQPDGKIIIAGAFSAVNGVARTNLVR